MELFGQSNKMQSR